MSRNQLRKLHARRTRWMLRAQRRDRRGVLLMVVLSMLALFLLLGTAFLVSSRFYATTGKEAGKLNRTTNNPADLMERAMLQVLRDTNNPSSSIRYHSLLRDVYGSDGFIAEVMVPDNARRDLMAQYSGASLPSAGSLATPPLLGHTQGQFIDLYVVDPVALPGELPDSQHVIKLERSPSGFTVDHDLETAKNYHAGCILTMLAGPAAGQSTRIISSQVIEYVQQPTPSGNSPRPIVRLRVMAFAGSNGEAMTPGKSPVAARDVELVDIAGYAFMVNGRANSGTGAGFNRLAQRGGAKLNAVETTQVAGGVIGTEIALTPNLRFTDLSVAGAAVGGVDPFAGGATFVPLNPNVNTLLYPTAEGPGGSNESYDAVDYQNMFLAHMPVSPRATASLIDANGVQVELGDTQGVTTMLGNTSVAMRPDMENTIVPSFHQPALINYWYQRLHDAPWLANQLTDENVRAATILAPYDVSGGGPGNVVSDQIVAIKRKISLRPIREDHPNFDGGNAASVYSGALAPVDANGQATVRLSTNNDIRFPAWEVVGPWDVDNDNDGINDSVWVDLGDPVQETENGTLYKPLYAFLIVDLDNRLNVNAHGSPDHYVDTSLDAMYVATTQAFGPARAVGNLAGTASSNLLPHGMGWGPGDVNLRSILSPLTQPYSSPIARGDNLHDDYARLFFGRLAIDRGSDAVWGRMGSSTASATYGPGKNFNGTDLATITATREPSLAYEFVGYPAFDRTRAEQAYVNSSFDPLLLPYTAPTAFATMPDLRGRYTIGVDYMGQPISESAYDGIITATPLYLGESLVTLVDESPYETYLSKDGRRGVPSQQAIRAAFSSGNVINDDALFTTSELERLLRRYDPETGTAPSRLFDIVDAFDPVKYASTINVGSADQNLAYAQTVTGINSRQVTTDSYEIPTPSDVVPSYITELGPDGAPGIVGVDDDGNGVVDDASEVGWHEEQDPSDPSIGLYLTAWSDDFEAYTGKSVAEARFVDVVWYRIQRAREKRGLPIYNWHNPQAVAIMNNICDQLLPPEVLAGYKMDINRPFGDGRDNGDGIDNDGNGLIDEPGEVGDVYLNGIVDEPAEAGEPYYDANGNGVWDNNEPFIDLNGNQAYDPPLDNLWGEQLAAIGAPAAMLDTVMGIKVAGIPYQDANGNGVRDPGEELIPLTVRNDAHLARQLYARHLYMLMMVLMDEDYLAPYDPADPTVRGFLRIKAGQLQSTLGPYEAKVEAQRRYTNRQIAQWAINCVDFRDSDSINSPFEFDEYPWDGWGTVNEATGEHFPLDGDPATDENYGQVIDWANMQGNGQKVITNPIPTFGAGGNQLADINATRAVVWGAERPELLISETAAFHDVRVEDLSVTTIKGDNTTSDDEAPDRPQDDDPDQRLMPRGSLFVEVYNPNSGDAPKPVELYRHGNWDRNGDGTVDDLDRFHYADINDNGAYDAGTDQIVEGVLLDRLSDRADRNGRRSPVWRLIVVEEPPTYHNERRRDPMPQANRSTLDPTRDNALSHTGDLQQRTNPNDMVGTDPFSPLTDYRDALDGATREQQQISLLAPMNLDWDTMYYNPPLAKRTGNNIPSTMSEWFQARTSERRDEPEDPMGEPGAFDRQLFAKPYPFIEREFYFTSNNTPFYAHTREITGSGTATARPTLPERSYTDFIRTNLGAGPSQDRLQNRYDELRVRIPFSFVDIGQQPYMPQPLASLSYRFVSAQLAAGRPDVKIAPILPGRYGVIGSAGTRYTDIRTQSPNRFITTLGRRPISGGAAGADRTKTDDEFHVTQINSTRRFEMHPSTNPFQQQWIVGANGARFIGSDQPGTRRNELMKPTDNVNDAVNMSMDMNSGALASEVLAPVVAVPVDNMNISEPAYGYGVRARELAQLQEQTEAKGHEWAPDAAEGEGMFTAADGTALHFDMPFDTDTVLADPETGVPAYERPFTLPKFRVVHLQRLADPTVPWNPPPGYNQAHRDRLIFTAHDPSLPVNPYLTVDSASVDLTVFNGASSVNPGQPQASTTFRSTERLYGSRRADATAKNVPARVTYGQDYFMTLSKLPVDVFNMALGRRSSIPQPIQDAHLVRENHHDFSYKHSLGYPNESLGPVYMRPEANVAAAEDPTDLNGPDNNPMTMGAALGAPRPDGNLTSTAPWMTWNNRPFVSESELLQVPGWSSMELLRKFSGMNTALDAQTQADMNPYNGSLRVDDAGGVFDAVATNARRYKAMTAGFGHLMNFQQTSRDPARILPDNPGPSDTPGCVGAPNFHRILDYVHTPSRFVATDTLLNPVAFSAATVTSPDDPRSGKAAPFNRVPDYREPGKVNLNTVVTQRGPSMAPSNPTGITVWSDVFDGLMHRVRDLDPIAYNQPGYGHLGPAWKDIVWSRRGFPDPVLPNHLSGIDRVDLVLNNSVPTFFGNPFRSSSAGDLVPLDIMKDGGADVSMLRAHPLKPGSRFQWGAPGVDNNGNGLMSDAREAGWPSGDDVPLVAPGGNPSSEVPVPLFSELTSTPGIDAPRNSAMHYMPLTRIDNLTTTRSGVFAVWVTVGYFEVLPAPAWEGDTMQKFRNQSGDTTPDALRARALYDKVYPQGYQLGKELKSETGDIDRHRSFYIIDRTRPVAFKPGEDVNVEDAILLRRRID